MATTLMKFTPDAARASSKTILANAQNIQKQINTLQATIDGLTWWKGESQDRFKKKFQSIKEDLNKTYACVERISQQLETMAADYERTETEIAAQIN
jgi:WXG100 family type VII secretion target